MKKLLHLKYKYSNYLLVLVFLPLFSGTIHAQQFNSDNYLTMPHGTGTFIITNGQRNANMYSVFSLLPRFELNLQVSLYWNDTMSYSVHHFTTNIFGKYMFWVNKEKNGGAVIFLGLGQSPGYYSREGYSPIHKNYWTALPVTIPLFNNMLSWDITSGAIVDFEYGDRKQTAWGFTYSTRLAIYKVKPQTAIVGELYGTEGQAYSKPEFKAGLSWEPNSYIVAAAIYGAALDGSKASGFEIGVMIFTSQFLKKDFIRNNTISL